MVVPYSKSHAGCFDNDEVEKKAHEQLSKLGITIYNGYKIVDWESTEIYEKKNLNSIRLTVSIYQVFCLK
jgi:uncharacterized FAD-dependent dehydrogenase